MADCDYCKTSTFIGGQRTGNHFFCNNECETSFSLMPYARMIPEEKADMLVQAIRNGACPKCNDHNGPVDMHEAYRILSAVMLSYWGTHPKLSCRSCGVKRQIGSALYCFVLGWWGFPFGLLLTPVQIVQNIAAIFSKRGEDGPSDALVKHVKLTLGAKLAEQGVSPLGITNSDIAVASQSFSSSNT